jgi:WD40 repeat protein
MNHDRTCHTATLLPDGRVLVTGGGYESSDVYDPTTRTWMPAAGTAKNRAFCTATLLPHGKVLVVGGRSAWDNYQSSAELFNPTTGAWGPAGRMTFARAYHTATLLPSGKVLIAGGGGYSSMPSIAELYDPATGTWEVTGAMSTPRIIHTATLLPNGKVLIAGGRNSGGTYFSSAELYDPANGTWTATSAMTTPRQGHTAILVPNGKVLVAGGSTNNVGDNIVLSSELYDPISGTWTLTSAMNFPRESHTATLLPNGRVLLAGGYWAGAVGQTELYDSLTGTNPPPILTCAMIQTSGSCQIAFSNKIGTVFTLLAATSPAVPMTGWSELGVVMELPPGYFQFIDSQAVTGPRRFFRVRSP